MGSIIVKDGDQLIPDDASTVFLKTFSKGSGLALAKDGQLETMATKSAFTSMEEALGEINNVQCPLKAETIVYYFNNYPDKMSDDDLQPFIVLAEPGETENEIDPMLAAFIDGDVSESFEPEGSDHTREYMAINTYLAPKFQKMYEGVGNDIEDFLKLLEDPLLKREILATLFDEGGSLVLVAATGDVCTFAHKAGDKTFDWGWVSNPCGYGEVPDKGTIDESIAATAKNVMANIRSRGVLATVRAGVTAATSSVPTKPAATATTPKPDTSKELGQVWARPPKHIRQGSNNQKSKWYDSRTNIRPDNWKECPAILMDLQKALKEGCDIVKTQDGQPVKPAEPLAPGVHAVPEKKKDTEPKHVGVSTPVPLISEKQQDYIVKEFLPKLQMVDGNSQTIPDPAKMVEEENKYPTFCDKAGLAGLENTFKWGYADVLPLFKNAPEAAAVLWINTRAALISNLSEKPTVTPKVEAPASTPATKAAASSVMPAVRPKRRVM